MLLPYDRDETNKMDDGIWSLKGFFSEGWKGEEHIDSTLGSSGRPPCLAAWPNAHLQLRQLEEENQRRVKEGKPSITLEALGLTWFYKHQWPHQTTVPPFLHSSSSFCPFAFLPGQEWQAESKAAAAAQEKKRVEEAVEARLQISFFI